MVPNGDQPTAQPITIRALQDAVRKALIWNHALVTGQVASIKELAKREHVTQPLSGISSDWRSWLPASSKRSCVARSLWTYLWVASRKASRWTGMGNGKRPDSVRNSSSIDCDFRRSRKSGIFADWCTREFGIQGQITRYYRFICLTFRNICSFLGRRSVETGLFGGEGGIDSRTTHAHPCGAPALRYGVVSHRYAPLGSNPAILNRGFNFTASSTTEKGAARALFCCWRWGQSWASTSRSDLPR